MAKRCLIEALEALQEYEFMGGPGMEFRPDYSTGARDPRNAPLNFKTRDGEATGDGPWNAQGRGSRGIGRGGVGWGGRPDDSGGIREPSGTYEATWGTQDEGADFEELQRHGEPRNIWRDTKMGKELKHDLEKDEQGDEELQEHWAAARLSIEPAAALLSARSSWIIEAMGSPAQIGQTRAMDFPFMYAGRDAGPVRDVDGTPQEENDNINDPKRMDPQGGPGTQWNAHTFGDRSAKNNFMNEETPTMNVYEFFNPKPVPVQEIENPEQDKFGDSTDNELEPGDDSDSDGDDIMGVSGNIGGADFSGTADEDGLHDLMNQLSGMEDSEPGDGDDIGEPENIMLTPSVGQSGFVMSPDKMGSARGLYGMHSDGAGASSMTDKSSAWDVLKKVVDAMSSGDEDADVMNPMTKG